jgi:hypothetical protein
MERARRDDGTGAGPAAARDQRCRSRSEQGAARRDEAAEGARGQGEGRAGVCIEGGNVRGPRGQAAEQAGGEASDQAGQSRGQVHGDVAAALGGHGDHRSPLTRGPDAVDGTGLSFVGPEMKQATLDASPVPFSAR